MWKDIRNLSIAMMVGVMIGIIASILLNRYIFGKEDPNVRRDTVTVTRTVREYVRFDNPEPPQLEHTSTVTRFLKVSSDERSDSSSVCVVDSVAVEIPMETKIWADQDSTYRIQTTGFETTVDWVEVYPLHTYTESTITIKKNPHFSVGIQAGYGLGASGGKVVGIPYIGIGLSYNLISF